ncbi:MAG: pyridoxamine 5'-phosphate oxidase family protein [Deltaproteobacteria bacterium]|nr:pyridoxamine 5'-phosphate oxidase family protein [Deltaproteobacteria bacterium]
MSVISEKVKEYLSVTGRMNVLSTANKAGETNVAMFGSFLLSDETTMMLMLGDNNTYANLKQNPHAALLVVLPGNTGMKTEGCRIYLKVKSVEDGGDMFDRMKAGVRAKVGDAANLLKHLVIFDIIKTRPILDMGQEI